MKICSASEWVSELIDEWLNGSKNEWLSKNVECVRVVFNDVFILGCYYVISVILYIVTTILHIG